MSYPTSQAVSLKSCEPCITEADILRERNKISHAKGTIHFLVTDFQHSQEANTLIGQLTRELFYSEQRLADYLKFSKKKKKK